ncbi:uncharacterized protein LOC126662321 [Mercurialis annua]|uniref:uncharacterized protein LOC126662321 n=1 Tax=Mercurialis annua TaxID=3986 RepID=UPI0024AEC62A|nr:uncharacterized protein LOC126662321 [Mercurialis annua]
MSPSITNSTGDLYSDEDVDDYEIDDDLDKDIEALGQACMRPYLNTTATTAATTTATTNFNLPSPSSADGDFSGDDGGQQEDDFELLRNIQKRFDSSSLLDISPTIEDDSDFDTLCAVQRRFAAYDNNDTLRKGMQNSAENVASDLDTCDAHTFLALEVNDISRFPKPTQLLHDAIKRNRSCQKFLESKLGHIQARIEENKKLKKRVDIIKGMQFFCRKTTGRDLALGKDPRIQLISVKRILSCETSKSKDNDKKVSAMHDGLLENSHVAYYRKALANSPHMMKHKKWKEAEKENLRKGIRQQFQELALQFSTEQFRYLNRVVIFFKKNKSRGVNELDSRSTRKKLDIGSKNSSSSFISS